jgi:hypothetical protein
MKRRTTKRRKTTLSAKVYCNGTDIRCLKKETLTVGMSGAVVEFEFSEEWAQLNKTAVFESDGSRTVQIAGGKATVPHEILTTPGMDVLVGVYTQREDGTTWPSPTPMCKIAQLKGGAKPDGDPSYPPTPDIAQQLIDAIKQLKEETGVREFYVQDNEPTEQKGAAFWINLSETDEEYQSDVARAKAPKLTAAQKQEIREVAKSYEDNGTTFYYDFNLTRNDFANNRCRKGYGANGDVYRFGLNCNTFVENVWMGRMATDFVGKTAATYSNEFKPKFDWGWMMNYRNRRRVAGLAARVDGKIDYYYNYQQPNKEQDEEDYRGSYSTTSSYDEDCTDTEKYPKMQWFRSFMTAADMAQELWEMGCEVPFDELDVGDLVFVRARGDKNTEEDTFFAKLAWRNIVHVALVYGKSSDGTLWFMDCTNRLTGDAKLKDDPIFTPSLGSSYESNVVEAVDILSNIAMCARHPAAWGKTNGTGRIDYIPMAYTTGYSAGQAIPFDFGMEITEGLYYVYNNELAIARATAVVFEWNGYWFDIQFTNAKESE